MSLDLPSSAPFVRNERRASGFVLVSLLRSYLSLARAFRFLIAVFAFSPSLEVRFYVEGRCWKLLGDLFFLADSCLCAASVSTGSGAPSSPNSLPHFTRRFIAAAFPLFVYGECVDGVCTPFPHVANGDDAAR